MTSPKAPSESDIRRAQQLFNEEAFFECHEALEALWKEAEDPEVKLLLQAVIHVAVALHHRKEGNLNGFENQVRKGLIKLYSVDLKQMTGVMRFDLNTFRNQVVRLKNQPKSNTPLPKLINGSAGRP
ncbi:MAG: DUF309 domain-containing protein [Bacteroidetes bacterium]|nr:DUF309 domain-containing protein [Bacteroidota bacterium]